MIFNDKWITVKEAEFTEQLDEKSGKKKFFLNARVVPKDEISRNKVKYNWESIITTMHQIPGIPLNHNHKFAEANDLPRGVWTDSWIEGKWLCAKAEVYDTPYNKDYIEYLKAAGKNITVSLNVGGEAKSVFGEDNSYQEAYINNWREISTVNVPGFLSAKSSLEQVLCESLKVQLQEMIEADEAEVDKVIDEVPKDVKENPPTEDAEVPNENPEDIVVNPAQEPEGEPLDTDYDFDQLKSGIIHELTIASSPYEAKTIAKKNLDEDKEYYKKIEADREQHNKNSIFLIKDKLNVVSQRRYGRTFDSLNDREQNKVLFSTDIEKGINDDITRELKTHYIKKAVEADIDKIINAKKEQLESFYEQLTESRDKVIFFERLSNTRRLY